MDNDFLSKLNIVFLSIIISCFFALISAFIAKTLMHPTPESLVRGYQVEVTTAKSSSSNTKINFDKLLNEADLSLAQSLTNKCVACHSFKKNGKNKVGPNLWNVFNNIMGSKEGYKYSKAFSTLNDKQVKWNPEKMMKFLKSPRSVVKKSKMTFIGLKTYEETAIVTKYLSINTN